MFRLSQILILLYSINVGAQSLPSTSLQRFVETWSDDSYLRNAGISLVVYDLNKNEYLADVNGNLSLVPASTMKLVTTASAMEILGTGYRFRTRLQYTGTIDSNGVLHGNVIIKGGGDPTLGSGYYSTYNQDFLNQWVKALKDAGIEKIDGQVIGDATIFGENIIPANWSWGDIGNYYGAPACGLTIYDNKTALQFRSGPNAGDSTWVACMDPYVPELSIYNKVQASNTNKDNAYIYGGLYDPYRIAEGTIPKGEENFEVKASIHDPAYLAAFELDAALADAGIYCEYGATTVRRQLLHGYALDTLNPKTIHTLSGATIKSLSYWTNMRSVNLFAEHLFKGVGVRLYGDGSSYSASRGVESYWQKKGIDMTGFSQNDGSGLSRANAVSAKHLVRILKHMNASKYAEDFKSTLSIAGKSGTLWSIGKGTAAANNLIGKSGSMTRVRSYAGYVKSASGRQLAFAVIVNNYNCNGYQMKQRLEKFMVALANYRE